MDIDFEELSALIELLKTLDFTEFRYEKGDVSLVLRRGELSAEQPSVRTLQTPSGAALATPSAASQAPAPPAPVATVPGAHVLTAPLLGTFYTRPRPGEAPFVQVGQAVQADTVVCIIEVMKLMNSIYAGQEGVIAAVHASEGDLVEFGQALFSIQESS